MNGMGKRRVALTLALCLALGLLAGCGKKSGGDQQLSATVYVPSYLDAEVDASYFNGGCVDGNNVYLIAANEKETPVTNPEDGSVYYNYETTYGIYRIPLDGSPVGKLSGYEAPTIPEGMEGNTYIESVAAGADGTLWVTEYTNIWGPSNVSSDGNLVTFRDEPVETEVAVDSAEIAVAEPDYEGDDPYAFEPQSTRVRRQLDQDGNELSRVDLSNLEEELAPVLGEDSYIGGAYFDQAGNLYITGGTKLYVLDPQMNLLFTLEGEDLYEQVFQLGDGRMGMMQWVYDEEKETSSYLLKTIDFDGQDWGGDIPMPPNVYDVFPGGGDYLFYYQMNDSIFGWRKDAPEGTQTGERLFAWLEADINSNEVLLFDFLPDGRIAAVTRSWLDDQMSVSVALLTATPRDQLPEKTTLTFATMYLNYTTRNQIIEFNKKSDQYRIEVRDYSEFNTNEDNSAGLTKLNTEIVAGQVPDILDTNGLPMRQYGAKGLFEDLWPFIENDPDLGRDGVMERPLMACEQDGKLYQIFRYFAIRTAVGAASVVGDRMSWTLADLQEALAKMPEGCSIMGQTDTKDGMLRMLLEQNMNDFVDWESGKCSFDSDNFKSLLEFCNSFPAEFNWDNVDWEEWEDDSVRVANGKQLLLTGYISEFDYDIQRYDALFGGSASFVGYPKEDGSVGSSFEISSGSMAISSTCKDKEGAWSFIRQLLVPTQGSDEYMYTSVFPVNKKAFYEMMEREMNPEPVLDENGEPWLDENGNVMYDGLGTIWVGDTDIEMHPATQEEVDRIMELYDAITTVSASDENIAEIVMEVAGAYFAGDKPLDNAVGEIQNRVSLYVGETK